MRSQRVYMPPTQGGAIAQLGERLNGIQEVVGSIPIGSTNNPLKSHCFLDQVPEAEKC
jgi:hypothetical protein